jgi:hypothetical protein
MSVVEVIRATRTLRKNSGQTFDGYYIAVVSEKWATPLGNERAKICAEYLGHLNCN